MTWLLLRPTIPWGKVIPPEKWATAIACLEQTRRKVVVWKGHGEARRWTRVQVNPAISTCSNCDKWQGGKQHFAAGFLLASNLGYNQLQLCVQFVCQRQPLVSKSFFAGWNARPKFAARCHYFKFSHQHLQSGGVGHCPSSAGEDEPQKSGHNRSDLRGNSEGLLFEVEGSHSYLHNP